MCSCCLPFVIKDGAYFFYCAYVLRISRWSEKVGFPVAVAAKTEIFLRGL